MGEKMSVKDMSVYDAIRYEVTRLGNILENDGYYLDEEAFDYAKYERIESTQERYKALLQDVKQKLVYDGVQEKDKEMLKHLIEAIVKKSYTEVATDRRDIDYIYADLEEHYEDLITGELKGIRFHSVTSRKLGYDVVYNWRTIEKNVEDYLQEYMARLGESEAEAVGSEGYGAKGTKFNVNYIQEYFRNYNQSNEDLTRMVRLKYLIKTDEELQKSLATLGFKPMFYEGDNKRGLLLGNKEGDRYLITPKGMLQISKGGLMDIKNGYTRIGEGTTSLDFSTNGYKLIRVMLGVAKHQDMLLHTIYKAIGDSYNLKKMKRFAPLYIRKIK